MDNMNPKFVFRSTKYNLPDLDCWAIEKLKVKEADIDEFYQSFLSQLKGTPFNIYSIAEMVNDHFKIQSRIKRSWMDIDDASLADIETILDFKSEPDGSLSIAMRPAYLVLIEPEYLPKSAFIGSGFDRICSVQYN